MSSGGLDSSGTIDSGGIEIVSKGGTATDATVSRGGKLEVLSGGTADPTTIESGGEVVVSGGGTFQGAILSGGTALVSSGGTIELTAGNQVVPTLAAGATLEVGAGVTLNGFTVSKGIALEVLANGTASGGAILSGGTGVLESGGVISGTITVSNGGIFEFDDVNPVAGSLHPLGGAIVKFIAGATLSGGTATSNVTLEFLSGGTDSGGTVVESGGKLIVASGGTAIDPTILSGGTAVVSSGGIFDVQTSATDFGTLTNSGAINVSSGATLTLSAATFTNAGSVDLLGGGAIVQIDRSLTLSGSGTVSLLGDGNNFIVDNNTSVTLTNHNTIAGAGTIGDSFMKLVNSGTINANNSVGLSVDAAVINAGKMEGTTSGIGLYIVGGGTNAGTIEATTGGYVAIDSAFTNSKTIEALGSGQVQIFGGTVSNTSNGVVLASGSHAIVYLQDTIVGGTLKTSAGGQILVTENSVLSGVTIGLGTVLDVADNETLTLSGTIKNSGTLFADGAGSEVDIVSGAVVNGGVAEIGDGIVEIAGSSGESVRFLSTGSGGLEIADMQGHTSAFAGMVSGFGGSAHSNQAQFIDLVSVTSAGLITSHYTSAAGNTSGTLTVSSGGTLVAEHQVCRCLLGG